MRLRCAASGGRPRTCETGTNNMPEALRRECMPHLRRKGTINVAAVVVLCKSDCCAAAKFSFQLFVSVFYDFFMQYSGISAFNITKAFRKELVEFKKEI